MGKFKTTIEILGSGTSTGVPIPGCDCAVCRSDDPCDSRLRTSIYMQIDRPDHKKLGILIDSPPDLRTQLLRSKITRVDAVLYTHAHADHINGIDDLRVFNFINSAPLPLYGSTETLASLERSFPHAFFHDPGYEGGSPPQLIPHPIVVSEILNLDGIEILPLSLIHGKVSVLGYRIGNFAYLPDCNQIPDETFAALSGLEVLVIDGLRDAPHKTHFTQRQAIEMIEKISPQKAYLTHISHDILHRERSLELKNWTSFDVELAYDQLVIEL